MLQSMRDKLVGWVAWAFVILIGLPFAIMGVTDFGSTARDMVVAEVDDLAIEQSNYLNRYQNRRQNIQRQMGGDYQPDRFDRVIQKQVLDTLIEEKLLARLAEDNNIKIGDDELSAAIKVDPVFQKDGKFDFKYYKSQIGRLGHTPASYEEFLHNERILSVVPRLIRASGFVTEQEARRYQRLTKQQRKIEYLVIGQERFEENVTVSEEEAQVYYKDHAEKFLRPEQIKLEYIRLSAEQLLDRIDTTEELMRQFYEANADRYITEEQRKASHILLGLPEGESLDSSTEVSNKLSEIKERLAAGDRFEDLAKQYSEDPGSASSGGDLGQMIRGVMVPSFEDALFSLQEIGQISVPVRTSFGIHLIRLDGITAKQVKSYEEVKDQLKKGYADEQSVNLFYDLSERMAEVSYEHPDSLLAVSEAIGVPVKTTEWLAHNNNLKGISGNRDILREAFSDRLKTSGNNSDPIEVGINDAVVFRVAEVRQSMQVPYDEVRDKAIEAVRTEKNDNRIKHYADKIAGRLRQGESIVSLSSSEKLTLESPAVLQRNSTDVPAALVRKVFRMQVPKGDHSTVQTISLAGGRQAVVLLSQVINSAADKAGLKTVNALSDRVASKDASNFLSGIRNNARVTIYKDKL